MLSLIASALNRKDEAPNIELAERLAKSKNTVGISEIVCGLSMSNAIAGDCIKVLYEIGEREPKLLVPHVEVFVELLRSKNNRLVWGSMAALDEITTLCPEEIFDRFDAIYAAYKVGSVITIDHSISVFAKLCSADKKYEKKVLPILVEHFEKCRTKEIPQHLERASVCITSDNSAKFVTVIGDRYDEMTDPQKTRVTKVLRQKR